MPKRQRSTGVTLETICPVWRRIATALRSYGGSQSQLMIRCFAAISFIEVILI